MLEITIANDEQVNIPISPKTHGGQPATLDGKPKWEIISGNCTISPAEDGLSCKLVSQTDLDPDPAVNTSVVQASADADLGDGVKTISDTITLHVVNAQAENLGLTEGEITKK